MAKMTPEERRALASKSVSDMAPTIGAIQTKSDPSLLASLDDIVSALTNMVEKPEPPEKPDTDYTKGLEALTRAVASIKDPAPLQQIADAIYRLAGKSAPMGIDYSPQLSALIDAVKANTRAIQEQTKQASRPREVEYDDNGTPTGIRFT